MAYDPARHHRRSIRMHDHDYRANGAYFITICTFERQCIFGDIRDGIWNPSQRGLIAQRCWTEIFQHRAQVALDEFVVMPNHVHGIVFIESNEIRATQVSPLQKAPAAGSLGAIVGAYKAAVSRAINRLRSGAGAKVWQTNYFEHVIRHNIALEAIREYIFTNPERWDQDAENPNGSGGDNLKMFLSELEKQHRSNAGQGNTSVARTGGAQ